MIYEKLINREKAIAVIGMGYVGMPIALSFSKMIKVIGFDINKEKISQYRMGFDPTCEAGNEIIQATDVVFTSEEKDLDEAIFFIVAVPTPVNEDKAPDLSPVENASRLVGRHLKKGAIVVYESTVYPGVTEDICIPILEEVSGLKCGEDFKIGYSPERINPGDKNHRLENIQKIVSGIDKESLNEISKVYELIIKAGVYRASNIRVAEAAKVIENSQRDINIAFMNEIAMVLDRMDIDTSEVIEAMNTKWNALHFYPGLVGGHCIGVDPYYFTYEAEKLGYHSQIVLSGRKINDGMGAFVAGAAIKQMVLAGKVVKKCAVVIMGITFKENCPDIRNSKVEDVIKRFREYGIEPRIVDPWANEIEVKKEYSVSLTTMEELKNVDCFIFAVAHDEFKNMKLSEINRYFINEDNQKKIIIDVKNIFSIEELKEQGYRYWRL